VRNTLALPELGRIAPDVYAELLQVMERLERHYRDVCDIEFTVENGKLWLLQTRVAQPTAEAVFRIAAQLADEGLIDEDEALLRVTGAHLSKLLFPRFADSTAEPLGVGVGASPGAAVGHAVFDSPTAVDWQGQGKPVILVRRETNPDDLDGMIASKGVLTARGGKTSHAAVVARAMGTPCVCGAEGLEVDAEARQAVVIGKDGEETVVAEGDLISIDGASGAYHLGALEAVPSEVSQYLDGTLSADDEGAGELVQAVHRLLAHADSRRRLGVRANADTGEDATMARRFGAEGIGLCRTEHQFLGDRRVLIERLVLSEGDERVQVLEDLLELQREDFISLFTAMAGLPVTVRLLDPPLHEFLPDLTELSVRVALAERDDAVDPRDTALLQAVLRLHESNPMLGLRGVRLGLVVDGLFAVQTRAIAQATATLREQGMEVLPEIMLPLVGSAAELRTAVDMVVTVLKEEEQTSGATLDIPVGTMIELPRAALTAADIAQHSEFFSFGTNDLTQTTWGISRDDAELSFLPTYLTRGIVEVSPFETIDQAGVGRLVRIAVEEGRAARPGLKLGVCGEHGGDPESIAFFHDVGLDYVSCSAFRVPVARLEAGRAAVLAAASGASGSEGARG
jgi:pyruvate,orthophosphate dikinase